MIKASTESTFNSVYDKAKNYMDGFATTHMTSEYEYMDTQGNYLGCLGIYTGGSYTPVS